jgi:adenylate cyclase
MEPEHTLSTQLSQMTEPPAEAIHEALRRLLASRIFSRSQRLSRFLRFVVERALSSGAQDLKETLIAIHVFDRSSDFDPGTDPIVRVEARRLRAKLGQYYQTEGREAEVEIELPTGAYVPRFRWRRPIPAVASPNEPPTGEERSLVVLPLINLSSNPDDEYFSDGLTEQIIHELTRLEDLRVVAWQSAFRLKGQSEDVRAVGEQLGVTTVLRGSVRRCGERVRVAVQLIRIADGRYLWSETYDRALRDVLTLQDEIAAAIATALRLRLSGQAMPARRGLHDERAFELYLRGRSCCNLRSQEGFQRSIEYYQQAAAVDPSFPLPHAGLADSYTLMAQYGFRAARELMPQAEAAAETALALDASLAEAHASLGLIRALYQWQWSQAEQHYRTAIALNPGYASAHQWYAVDFLALLGRFEEALSGIHRALELDPLSPILNEGPAYIYLLSRQYARAAGAYRKIGSLDPAFYHSYTGLGRVYSLQGNYDNAIAFLEKGRLLAGDVPTILGALGHTLGLAGRKSEARSLLARLRRVAETTYVPSSCFALIHLGLGQHGEALRWLEQGCERRELNLAAMGVHPVYDPLRGEARFTALLRKMGLAGVEPADSPMRRQVAHGAT